MINNSTKINKTTHFKSLNTKSIVDICRYRNPGPGLGWAHNCDGSVGSQLYINYCVIVSLPSLCFLVNWKSSCSLLLNMWTLGNRKYFYLFRWETENIFTFSDTTRPNCKQLEYTLVELSLIGIYMHATVVSWFTLRRPLFFFSSGSLINMIIILYILPVDTSIR